MNPAAVVVVEGGGMGGGGSVSRGPEEHLRQSIAECGGDSGQSDSADLPDRGPISTFSRCVATGNLTEGPVCNSNKAARLIPKHGLCMYK